jgi:uncharacterized protein (TIGR02246 family)
MHRTRWAVLLLVLGAGAACLPTSDASELDATERAAIESEVREAVGGMFAAMNAHDADGILEHYTERDDFLYVGIVNPAPGRGLLEQLVRTWAGRDSTVTVSNQVVHIQVLSPTVATVFSQGGFSSNEHGSAWTHVLLREADGPWRIVLEHEGWPSPDARVRLPHPATGPGQ